MTQSRIARALSLSVGSFLLFAAGYVVNEFQSNKVIKSLFYTDLLTDVRVRLRTIGLIDSKQYEKAVQILVAELRTDVLLLEQFQSTGELGTDGLRLLAEAKQRTHAKP
jgi:hypothetical protein